MQQRLIFVKSGLRQIEKASRRAINRRASDGTLSDIDSQLLSLVPERVERN
jgi:hypothetical protein